jgi:hypothetical protein
MIPKIREWEKYDHIFCEKAACIQECKIPWKLTMKILKPFRLSPSWVVKLYLASNFNNLITVYVFNFSWFTVFVVLISRKIIFAKKIFTVLLNIFTWILDSTCATTTTFCLYKLKVATKWSYLRRLIAMGCTEHTCACTIPEVSFSSPYCISK